MSNKEKNSSNIPNTVIKNSHRAPVNNTTDKSKVYNLHAFEKDSFVVLPSHGVGKLIDVEEREIFGEKISLYKINFAQDNMDVFIPNTRLEEAGLRKIVSPDMIEKIFSIVLSKPPRNPRGVWNKRMQEYDAKIYSGSLLLTAEVVRDGFSCATDSNKSYSERSRYKLALQRTASEVSIVLQISYEEAEKRILQTLRSIQDKKVNDKFDVDFEDFAIEDQSTDDEDEDEKRQHAEL